MFTNKILNLLAQMLKKSEAPNGNEIIKEAIEEAKEALAEYREMQALEEGAESFFGGGFFGRDKSTKISGVSALLGALFGGEIVGGMIAFIGGLFAGLMSDSSLFDGFETPGDMDPDELEVYQDALIDAFGFTAFQVDDWTNWVDVEEYVLYQDGFTKENNGSNIKGLLQDGEYYRIR